MTIMVGNLHQICGTSTKCGWPGGWNYSNFYYAELLTHRDTQPTQNSMQKKKKTNKTPCSVPQEIKNRITM